MAALNELIQKIENEELRAQIQAAADKLTKQKKFGLVFEEHLPECTPLYDIPVKKGRKVSVRGGKANEIYIVLSIEDNVATCLRQNSKEAVQFAVDALVVTAELGDPIYPCLQPLDEVCNAPDSDLWHTLIEADNYHALQLLEYLYAGKVDCIYIDPPYNTGTKNWKYNNDYVDSADSYRHSKWLSFIQKRLQIAKKLLNPKESVLIVTIDEKEYLHLGCLLEELFPEAYIQMVTSMTNKKGSTRKNHFCRREEYIYVVFIGDSYVVKTNDDMIRSEEKKENSKTIWNSLLRRGADGSSRTENPNLFYPFFISSETNKIVDVGDSIPLDTNRHLIVAPEGTKIGWPIRSDGSEGRWQVSAENARVMVKNGTMKAGKYNKKMDSYAINYLKRGQLNDLDKGILKRTGTDQQGAGIFEYSDTTMVSAEPGTLWVRDLHDASVYGSTLLRAILPGRKFPYPKSVYAVVDTLRFFVANKPNALIIDFFAGSGTTLNAVNILNSIDNGKRRCIMVTNNEVSNDESKELTCQGFKPGDEEWEKFGVARYITWPRTVCSIEGHDINGKPLNGSYIGVNMSMADGFKTNANFYKLGFLDKTKVSLGMQFKELLSILWMKAGAVGRCPVTDANVPDMLILPENKMAILNDENRFGEFSEQLAQHPEIEVVYLVTDYESSFVAMTHVLEGKKTYQLYRDYLDNFRINAGRNGR